jgi:hypothetical protein
MPAESSDLTGTVDHMTLEPAPPDPIEQLIVGLVPGIGQQIADFRRDRHAVEQHRARVVAEEAAAATGWTAEELLEHVAGDDRLADLLMRAIEAARRTGVEEKLAALGRAVASGALAADDADVDEAELFIRTLDDIGAAEIRALIAMSTTIHRPVLDAWATESDAEESASDAIDASLERHGLVQRTVRMRQGIGSLPLDRPPSLDQRRRVTMYGRRLLLLLGVDPSELDLLA